MQVYTSSKLTSVDVASGAQIVASLAQNGPLKFNRVGASMPGKPELFSEDGQLVMQFSDGTTLQLEA